jgi:hypothetical protein
MLCRLLLGMALYWEFARGLAVVIFVASILSMFAGAGHYIAEIKAAISVSAATTRSAAQLANETVWPNASSLFESRHPLRSNVEMEKGKLYGQFPLNWTVSDRCINRSFARYRLTLMVAG